MALNLSEGVAVSSIAKHLYDFLPASGNSITSFPLAAAEAGIAQAWPDFKPSKLPGVTQMLAWTLEHRRDRFTALIVAVVKQSIKYRSNKPNPLTRSEIETLNRLLLLVQFKIPELHDEILLRALAESANTTSAHATGPATKVSEAKCTELGRKLLDLSALAPQPRGYAFERFLVDVFEAFNLAPRGAFKLVGEQIDGSFVLHHETFLLEAKWENNRTGSADLRAFSGMVSDKAAWSRGLFISNSGFTNDGLEAFGRGKAIILMDGLDLYEILHRQLNLVDVLAKKVRRAAETGRPFVPVRDL
jgi:restriction endonuclease Mrr